ncbi:MAG: globin, partial [Actinomycetes bacterium]
GGPATYSQERGEPRLGRRHVPFRIGPAERDAWVGHMTDAVKAGGLSPLDETQMLHFFGGVARSLVNQPDA